MKFIRTTTGSLNLYHVLTIDPEFDEESKTFRYTALLNNERETKVRVLVPDSLIHVVDENDARKRLNVWLNSGL
jgi:hypothetical protein